MEKERQSEIGCLPDSIANPEIKKNDEDNINNKLNDDIEIIKNAFRNKNININEFNNERIPVNENLMNSNVRHDLMSLVNENKGLNDADPLWEAIEKEIVKVSPNFFKILRVFSPYTLSTLDIRTAMLIKIGMKTSQIAILCCREPNTISSRKNNMGKKLFGKSISSSSIDNLLRYL